MNDVPIDQLATAPFGDDENPVTAALRRQEALQVFGDRLDTLYRKQVAERSLLEERWAKDLRQYNGEYEQDVLAPIRERGGSEAFINLSRAKCNATESRLADMLLPTDDRNWSIEPTPIPDGQQAGADPEAAFAVAKKASDRMQRIMDDQLTECGYNAVIRTLIHNMVVLGTGILKGPVIRNRVKQTFGKAPAVDVMTGTMTDSWKLQITEDLTPGVEAVSPWDFFPDMRATRMEDAEFVFQRHRMTKSKLRELAELPGFMTDQIKEAIDQEPERLSIDDAQRDSADRITPSQGVYEVIEYHGPLEPEDLVAAGLEVDPDNSLRTYRGTVWFCNRRVIKATLSMLDTGEMMFDAVPLERDNSMIFGFSVPYLMRHSQRAGNAAWRMVLDNARLSVGGQVIYKEGRVKPVDGDYQRLYPLKTWKMTDPNGTIADVFGIVQVQTNFSEMFRILEVVRELQDEETGLPMIAQGQQSPSVTKTAQGMSILMNSANTILRRLVKEFDDAITKPFIRRLYHWNMQYGEDEKAKGDYQVVPLGSTSLIVREQQAQGLLQLAQLAGSNPEFASRTKWDDLLRTIVKTMNINAENIVKSAEEVAAEQQNKPQQIPPELQIEMAKLEMAKAELMLKKAESEAELQLKKATAEAETAALAARTEAEKQKAAMTFEAAKAQALAALEAAKADMARVQVDRELALLKLAAERDMTLQEIRKEFGIKSMELESAHQRLNSELAIKREMGSGV